MNLNPSKQEEMALINLLSSGDRQSGRIFIGQYGKVIWSAVLSVNIRSTAVDHDDLFMEALGHLFFDNCKVLKSFKCRCKLSSYLYTVTRRYVVDKTMQENRRCSKFSDTIPDTLAAECKDFDKEDDWDESHRDAFKEAIENLDPKDALFIRMLIWEEQPTSEVMRFFGWNSENTVYARKNKVIAKLRAHTRKALQRKGIFV